MPGCANAVKTRYMGKSFHGHLLIISKLSVGRTDRSWRLPQWDVLALLNGTTAVNLKALSKSPLQEHLQCRLVETVHPSLNGLLSDIPETGVATG